MAQVGLIVSDRDWDLHIEFQGGFDHQREWSNGRQEFKLDEEMYHIAVGRKVQALLQDADERERQIYYGPQYTVYLELGELRVVSTDHESVAPKLKVEAYAPWKVVDGEAARRANWESPKHMPADAENIWLQRELEKGVTMTCVWKNKQKFRKN